MKSKLIKDVLKATVALVVLILLCRVTKGLAAGALVVWVCFAALQRKNWVTLSCFAFFPFLIVMNPAILPKSGSMGIIFRAGTALMALSFIFSAVSRRGGHKIPLGGLFLYLIVATVSSMTGYCPIISYMKELNFFLFILGIWLGTRNIHRHADDLHKLRCVMLAICVITIFGSWVVLPFPGIAYPQTVRSLMQYGGLSAAEAAAEAADLAQQSYFAGMTNHSNALSPLLACSAGFLLCDMLFVERRFSKFHILLLLLSFPLMYLTKSRGAFVTLVAAVSLIYFYGTTAIPTRLSVKTKARNIIMTIAAFVAVGAMALEIKDQGFSRYLRKNMDSSKASLCEAMTASRMGLIEMNLHDFRRNPLLGSGFQTTEAHAYLYQKGLISIFSAPIEKGVLPVMILGETGILGEAVFVFWLLAFFVKCRRRNYACTVCMLGVLLASNMGEASFFSPGGVGGILWIMTVVAGYLCDMQVIYRRDLERRMAEIERMEQMNGAWVRR